LSVLAHFGYINDEILKAMHVEPSSKDIDGVHSIIEQVYVLEITHEDV
jgi:hypothetical protein